MSIDEQIKRSVDLYTLTGVKDETFKKFKLKINQDGETESDLDIFKRDNYMDSL